MFKNVYTSRKKQEKKLGLSKKEISEYNNIKQSALKRNKEFKLSLNQVKQLMYSNCFYCGDPPRKYSNGFVKNGIDRIDNTKGYEFGNMISCCSVCNKAKGTLTYEEFLEMCQKVINRESKLKKIVTTFGKNSPELWGFMLKCGRYLSPNQILESLKSKTITKKDIHYDFKMALNDFPQEYQKTRKYVKRLTKRDYINMQIKEWNYLTKGNNEQ